ncbi:conserved hypothetical protein [Neospora caninum Liverpool]|uniref:Noc2p family protein n=1 Tax=Neospora caninum (strain Liverpool) TaxID=572307 RepID=F0VGN8_NEOCL|nr:conserved hypothetical protein [Neospora caninum Liverpool]CBZ52882.1 conserved hypothetical protein [Neospora caninum Liverpool]CEL66864.1 TPA: Noc2p family protein [Neospora caninum Liverpool]|eukprot:XP_003882914.1 conserved hypothetical protein [Neospora caninum Liverpool]
MGASTPRTLARGEKPQKRAFKHRLGLKEKRKERGREEAAGQPFSKLKLAKTSIKAKKSKDEKKGDKHTARTGTEAGTDEALLESDLEEPESPLGVDGFEEEDDFDEEKFGNEGDRDEEDEENYDGAEWLADDEEAWASSDEETEVQAVRASGEGLGVFADSPAAQKAFEGVLKKRLMKDKEFLSFLLQESEKQQARLSPAPSEDEASEDDEFDEDAFDGDEAPQQAARTLETDPQDEEVPKNLLTVERYEHLCHLVCLGTSSEMPGDTLASPSLRSLQLFLSAFRSAVRQTGTRREDATSDRAGERTKDDAKYRDSKKQGSEEEAKKRGAASAPASREKSRAERKSMFLIRDEDLRLTVLLRTVQRLPRIVRNFLGDTRDTSDATSAANDDIAALVESPSWSRLRLPLRWFFADLCELLGALQNLPARAAKGKDVLVQILLCLAKKKEDPLPFLLHLSGSSIPRRLLLTVASCWAFTRNGNEQLAAFAALRRLLLLRQRELDAALQGASRRGQSGAAKNGKKKGTEGDGVGRDSSAPALKDEERVQDTLQTLLRVFQRATSRNVGNNGSRTWRGANRIQLLRNEYLELLRLVEPRVVYRIAYQSIRELALTVRSVMVISSQATPSKGKKTKTAFLHARRLATSQKLLYSWAFLSTASLWSAAFASCVSLRPLAFPLVTLLCAALKTKLAALAYTPFCLNLLSILHQTALSTNLLIPLNAYVFALFELILRQQSLLSSDRYTSKRLRLEMQERKNKKKGKKLQKKDKEKDNLHLLHSRAADPEVSLRLSAAQQDAMHVMDGLVESFQRLLTEHLGYLVLHPAFPEISLPIKRSLRRTIKLCKSQAVVRSLKALVAAIDSSATAVQSLRCELKDLPVGGVEVFTEKKQKVALPLFVLRQQAVEERRKFIEEKVKGEISAAAERKQAESDALKTPRQLKRERQRQKKEDERREMEELSKSMSKDKKKRVREQESVSSESGDNRLAAKSAKRENTLSRVLKDDTVGHDDILDEIGSDLDDL